MVLNHRRCLAVTGTVTGDKPFGSNSVRLSSGEWLFISVVILALFCFVPMLWEKVEKFEPETDYRLPYKLNSDYWLYKRYGRWACSQEKTLVVGDSVVWGHYVSKNNTLSHYLNEIVGRDMFVNMGVDGIHPVALAGLLRYYGRDITGKDIILQFNPLWISSQRHDLQSEKEFNFNHPKLVPQLIPKIPCYKVSFSERISAVLERYLPFFCWTSHLKKAYFDGMSLPAWTVEHPYQNPLKNITLEIPACDDYNLNEIVPWHERGVAKEDIQWVTLESSLQWKFFRQAVELLRKRGNNVLVLVGPFNEHILKGKSIDIYHQIKSEIEGWLRQNNVPYFIPLTLPSEMYCDVSHPLSQGYTELAKELFESAYRKSGRASFSE